MDPSRLPVLEIGGTHVTAALVDAVAWSIVPGSAERRALDTGGSADEIISMIIDAAASLQPADRSRWGVAIPGPFDYARGVADFHGVGKLDALRGVDLGAALRRGLTGGTGRITFVNDAEAFAVGEWTAGAAYGHDRAIGLTLGTGVGSTFLVHGIAQRDGSGVPPEGRFDLLEIAGHPLEDTISRRAIQARYAARTGSDAADQLDVREIAARARDGEHRAILVMGEALRALGRVLAPRAAAFGATVVVVGGSVALAWDVIEEPLSAGMSEASPAWRDQRQLVSAQQIHEAALLGAARQAIRIGT